MNKDLPQDPKDYYVYNDITVKELAELYKGQRGCSYGHLAKRCTEERWTDLRWMVSQYQTGFGQNSSLNKSNQTQLKKMVDGPLDNYLKTGLVLRTRLLAALLGNENALKPLLEKDDGTINPLVKLVLADVLTLLKMKEQAEQEAPRSVLMGIRMDIDNV